MSYQGLARRNSPPRGGNSERRGASLGYQTTRAGSKGEFVRSAAVLEAERTLADRTSFVLDEVRWNRFVEILDRPPRVPAGLEELFSRPSVFE
jgi:hypothetical protein